MSSFGIFVGFLNFNRDKTARYVYAHPADIVTFQLNIAFYLICIEIVFPHTDRNPVITK